MGLKSVALRQTLPASKNVLRYTDELRRSPSSAVVVKKAFPNELRDAWYVSVESMKPFGVIETWWGAVLAFLS